MNKTIVRLLLALCFLRLCAVPLMVALGAPIGSINVDTNGVAMIATNVQRAPYRLTWSGSVAIVSTSATPLTINGARVPTTNDLRAGTMTNLNVGGSNYSASATIRAGTAIEFSFDATGVTISANGLAPDLATLSNDVLSVSGTADSALPMTGGTMTGLLASISSIAGVSYTETNAVLVAGSAIDDLNGIYTNSFSSGYFRTPQPASFSATLTWQPLDSEWVIQSNSVAYLRRINPSIVGVYDEHPGSPGASGAVVSATAYTGAVVSASGLRGNGAGITNVSASSLASGTIPAGVLGTNVSRTIGGLTTTGTVTAASFVGNGSGLTGIVASAASNPYTNFFYTRLTSPTNFIYIPIPSNADCTGFRIKMTSWRTNNAHSAANVYIRKNNVSGTNALYAYQAAVSAFSAATVAAGGGDTNQAIGAYVGRVWSDRQYSNSVSQLVFEAFDIHDTAAAQPWVSDSFFKARPSGAVNTQIRDCLAGSISIGGSWTQAVIVIDGSTVDSNTLITVCPVQ